MNKKENLGQLPEAFQTSLQKLLDEVRYVDGVCNF